MQASGIPPKGYPPNERPQNVPSSNSQTGMPAAQPMRKPSVGFD